MNRLKYIFIFSLFFQVSYSQTYSWTYVGEIVQYPYEIGGRFYIDSLNNFINFSTSYGPPYRSIDEGKTWTTISSINLNPFGGGSFYGDTIGSGIKITKWDMFRDGGITHDLPPSSFLLKYLDVSILV